MTGIGHAVVIGGSIGGLLAARVLGETFARVSVLERGPEPGETGPRDHGEHGLAAGDRAILDELFPGLIEDLTSGGVLARAGEDGGLLVSPPRLARCLRDRVAALPGVEIHRHREVVGLLAAGDRRGIRGVRAVSAGSGPEEVPADLVVNATGGDRGAIWLGSLGYDPALEEHVDSGASIRRRYERIDHLPEGYLVFADALCRFAPAHGPGTAVAARQAIALRQCLRGGPGGLARRFLPRAARIIDGPWNRVVGGDPRSPWADEHRTPRPRLRGAHLVRALRSRADGPRASGRPMAGAAPVPVPAGSGGRAP